MEAEVMKHMMKKLVSIIAFLSLLTACERGSPYRNRPLCMTWIRHRHPLNLAM